jgi:hypothetical protein
VPREKRTPTFIENIPEVKLDRHSLRADVGASFSDCKTAFHPFTYCAPHLALHLQMVVVLDPHDDGKDVLRQKR